MPPPIALHRAPWLLSMAEPVLCNGAVALQNNRIVVTGRFADVKVQFPGAEVIDHSDCVLMPGLVNAHTHLELSHLTHLARQTDGQDFTSWLTTMLAERERLGAFGARVEKAAREMLKSQFEGGIIALGDIGNTSMARSLVSSFPGRLLTFLEYLGLGRASLVPALKKLERLDNRVACTAHAPYSTHPELICALKQRAERLGYVFPIHVAEPAAETRLLCEGRGELADFLRQKGFYEDVFRARGIDISGSVQYLHSLGILNQRTICVHAIHVSVDEMKLLAQSRAKVCLCPGSNRFLQVGKAPLSDYLAHGILPALGTDSAASNPELSIWREMKLVAEDHPTVDPFIIVKMATIGGAQVLGIDDDYGTVETGKSASMLAVSIPPAITDPQVVVEYLVHDGSASRMQWLNDLS